MPERIYVSYVPLDKSWSDRLAYDLSAAGIGAEFSAPDLDAPGQTTSELAARIYDRVAKCDGFVLLLSPEALTSYRINREMYQATTRSLSGEMRRPVLVTVRPFDPRQLPAEWAPYILPGIPVGDYWSAFRAMMGAWTVESAIPDQSVQSPHSASWRRGVLGRRGDSADRVMLTGLGLTGAGIVGLVMAIGQVPIIGLIGAILCIPAMLIGIVTFIIGLVSAASAGSNH